jgi:class 3 adenylate cyclase
MLLALYLLGYGLVPVLNRGGNTEGAAGLLLGTGLVNIAAVNFTVGFRTGTAVFLVAAAVGAVLVTDASSAVLRWSAVVASVLVFGLLAVLNPPVAPAVAESWVTDLLVVASFAGVVTFVVLTVRYQRGLTDTAEEELIEAHEQSERLLLNILPADVAARLKSGEYPIADRKPEVTVLFADIVESTAMAEMLSADDLVTTLDSLFSLFDDIADEHGLEKIKTVGDSYFAVAGLSPDNRDSATAAADAALTMRNKLVSHQFPHVGQVHMRFGLHTGSVVAGVIGKRKFSYDLWGDTVNTANRMESTAETDAIQVSQQVYERIKDQYHFEPRGSIAIKGKGTLTTFDLIGEKPTPKQTESPSR